MSGQPANSPETTRSGIEQREVVAFLSSSGAYPGLETEVTAEETHISWVFLTGDHAYKLKKAVKYDFLDYSTPELRRAACEEELRLNRRMAPGVYLAVEPVTREPDGRLRLAGSGTPVDWVVKMRRLPHDRALDVLIRDRRVQRGDVDRAAAKLAEFYAAAPPLALQPSEYTAAYTGRIQATWHELARPEHELPELIVERVNAAQLRFVAVFTDLLEGRVAAGRVIDGHGDLRAEHVYLLDPPVVFDCIEFNASFRAIDATDELCFLAMECDRLGGGWVGSAVLDRYQQASGDRPPGYLLDFYKSYRASVRAKVAALRALQHAGPQRVADRQEALEYLDLAERYAERLGRPPLVVVRGLAGTGKSTLAEALRQATGARLLRTDLVRRQMLDRGELPRDDRYRPENRALVYEALLSEAESLLAAGLMVIADGTFLERAPRRAAAAVSERAKAPLLFVRCQCPSETARERIERRAAEANDPSEATVELHARQRAAEEPDEPGHEPLVVDTRLPIEDQLASVRGHLARLIEAMLAKSTA